MRQLVSPEDCKYDLDQSPVVTLLVAFQSLQATMQEQVVEDLLL